MTTFRFSSRRHPSPDAQSGKRVLLGLADVTPLSVRCVRLPLVLAMSLGCTSLTAAHSARIHVVLARLVLARLVATSLSRA